MTTAPYNHSDICAMPGCGAPRHEFPSGLRAKFCTSHMRPIWASLDEKRRRRQGMQVGWSNRKYPPEQLPVRDPVLPFDDWQSAPPPVDNGWQPAPVPRHYPRYRFQRGKLRRALVLGKRAAYTDWRHNVIVTGRVAIECEEAMPPNMLEGDRRRRMAALRVAGYIVGESEG